MLVHCLFSENVLETDEKTEILDKNLKLRTSLDKNLQVEKNLMRSLYKRLAKDLLRYCLKSQFFQKLLENSQYIVKMQISVPSLENARKRYNI